jgi:hypothetical protein
MNETLRTQIEEHCQMVQRGAKPLSFLPHQEKYIDEIMAIIKSHDLHCYSEILSEGWRTIYIFKNKKVRFIIAELPREPKTILDHTLIGLLLGYGIDSICDYISQHCPLDEPNLM